MLHRITGRAVKCVPAAIAGVPTHEAAAVILWAIQAPGVTRRGGSAFAGPRHAVADTAQVEDPGRILRVVAELSA